MFNLKAANHEVILTSEVYKQKASALAGIESVRASGAQDQNFEIKMSSKGEPDFVLKAANHEIIGKSERYSSEAAAKNGIESVKKNCGAARVVIWQDRSLRRVRPLSAGSSRRAAEKQKGLVYWAGNHRQATATGFGLCHPDG